MQVQNMLMVFHNQGITSYYLFNQYEEFGMMGIYHSIHHLS